MVWPEIYMPDEWAFLFPQDVLEGRSLRTMWTEGEAMTVIAAILVGVVILLAVAAGFYYACYLFGKAMMR